jgi:O-antigen/teichoic acid export membrane protein
MGLRKEITKSTAIYVFGKNLSAVLAFSLAIVLPRLLKPHDFGLYSFCLFIVGFSRIFLNLGLDETLIRFTANYIAQKRYDRAAVVVRTIFKYKFILTLVVGASISLFSDQIAGQIFNKPEGSFMVFLAGFLLVLLGIYDFIASLFFGTKNMTGVSTIQVLQYFFRFIFAVGLVLLGFGIFGAVLGVIISFALTLLVAIFIMYRKHSFIFTEKGGDIDKRTIFTFSMWLFIILTVGGFYGLVDQAMISRMLKIEDIGFYKIGLSWMYAIMNVIPLSTQVLFPYFSSLDKSRLNILFSTSFRYAAMLIFPIAFLLSSLSEPFVIFLYGEEYLPVSPVLKVLAIVSVPVLFTTILFTFYSGIKKPEIIAKVVIVMVCVNIVLNYVLILEYGISGAAIATLISKIIEFFILFAIAVSRWKLAFSYLAFLKPLMVSVAGTAVAFNYNIVGIENAIIYAFAFLIFYVAAMWLVKGITHQDVEYLKSDLSVLLKKLRHS